jgi:hypothetical protein
VTVYPLNVTVYPLKVTALLLAGADPNAIIEHDGSDAGGKVSAITRTSHRDAQ